MSKSKIGASIVLFLLIAYRYILMWCRVNNNYTNVLFIITALFSLILLTKSKINIRQFKFLLFAFIFILVSYINGKTIDIFVSLIIAAFYINIDFNNRINVFVKDYTYISIFFYSMTIVLYYLGFLNQFTSSRMINGIMETRNSLGFIHVNATFMYFIPILLGVLYIHKNDNSKIKFLYFIILNLISVILYSMSLCRTGMIIVIFIDLLFLFQNKLCNSKKLECFTKYSYIILPFLLVFIFKMTANDFSYFSLNKLLSQRPYFINQAISAFPIKILGNNINGDYIIDCFYLKVLLNYGLLSYIFYSILYIKSFELIKKDYWLKVIYISFMIYQIFENNLLYQTNFLLILEFIILLQNKRGRYDNEKK